MRKNTKKLTVKDIVEECNITRQAFYYYFEDIPDLLKWILESKAKYLVEETLNQGDAEKGLRCLFLLALNIRPYVKHGLQTNYRDEIERIYKLFSTKTAAVFSPAAFFRLRLYQLRSLFYFFCGFYFQLLYILPLSC